MGVRGAATLLACDPQLYGSSWVLRPTSNFTKNDRWTIIYIDGPALLYYLISPHIASEDKEHVIPNYDHFSSLVIGTYSPEVVYQRCLYLVSALVEAGAHKIFLVMDGVADKSKLSDQHDRIMRRGKLCNDAFKEEPGLYELRKKCAEGVPHLFAEKAMISAFEDIGRKENNANIVFIHYAEGEAEGYIISCILNPKMGMQCNAPENSSMKNTNVKKHENPSSIDSIILSNDTDFLIHDSPGFVPLQSLEITRETKVVAGDVMVSRAITTTVVKGWRYLRLKFLSAFGLDSSQMAIVAALAGCDYTVTSKKSKNCLIASRKSIVASQIGGLRMKEKKKPSAKSSLVAVIRFVSYHGNKWNKSKLRQKKITHNVTQNTFLRTLAASIESENKTKHCNYEDFQIELIKAIQEVITIYVCDKTFFWEEKQTGTMTEIRRVVDQNIFFCPPVVEAQDDTVWYDSCLIEIRKRLYAVFNCRKGSETSSCRDILLVNEMSASINPIVTVTPCAVTTKKAFYRKKNESRSIELLQCMLFNANEKDHNTFIIEQTIESIPREFRLLFITGVIMLCYNSNRSAAMKTEEFILFSLFSTFPFIHKNVISPNDIARAVRKCHDEKKLQRLMTRMQLASYHANLICHVCDFELDSISQKSWRSLYQFDFLFLCYDKLRKERLLKSCKIKYDAPGTKSKAEQFQTEINYFDSILMNILQADKCSCLKTRCFFDWKKNHVTLMTLWRQIVMLL